MENSNTYFFVPTIGELIQEIHPNTIISRTIFDNDSVKVVLFAFDAGQELSEHTASIPAVIHILTGEVELSIQQETYNAAAGSWVYLMANTSHSIYAKSATRMLLYLLKKE